MINWKWIKNDKLPDKGGILEDTTAFADFKAFGRRG